MHKHLVALVRLDQFQKSETQPIITPRWKPQRLGLEGPVVQHRPQDAQALFNLLKREVLTQPPLLERRG
ncbi:hypothetical protein [Ktedonobacter sp. SOSP1-52]|uniref:hypothetical protein n=1 Tax=Ktedonobacter sp. SOSP1-52 TaxID=2778366 RepID=UPI0019153AE4|nr:hypothetical protein [Ktedonobacter sp. SOSP1-52]